MLLLSMRFSRLLLLGSTLVIFTLHSFAYQDAPGCSQITIEFSLKAGEGYEQRIGKALTFKVRAVDSLNPFKGWTFSLEDHADHDYIAPVNLPLRFNPTQTFGPGYGLTTLESLKMPRAWIRFLVNESDFRRISLFWRYALWPANAPDPDKAVENYLEEILHVRTGVLHLTISQADVSPDGSIRSANFSLEFLVPSEIFQFNPALKPKAAWCGIGG